MINRMVETSLVRTRPVYVYKTLWFKSSEEINNPIDFSVTRGFTLDVC